MENDRQSTTQTVRAQSLTHDVLGSLIRAQANEFRMTEVIVSGPFKELELANEGRLQPLHLGHLRRGEPLSPPAAFRLWQVDERADVGFEPLELLRQLPAHCRCESAACPRYVHQLALVVIA